MEAQSIFPFKTTGVPRQGDAAHSLNDVFHDILRAREARERPERDIERDMQVHRGLDRGPDRGPERRETRDLDRNLERRETRDLDRNRQRDAARETHEDRLRAEETRRADAREPHGCQEDQQPRAGCPGREPEHDPAPDGRPAAQEAAAPEPKDTAQDGDMPAGTEVAPSETASNGEETPTAAAALVAASLDPAGAPAKDAAPTSSTAPAATAAPTPETAESAKSAPELAKPAGSLGAQAQATTAAPDPAASKPGAETAPRPSVAPATTATALSAAAPAEAEAIVTALRPDADASSAVAQAKKPGETGPQAEAARVSSSLAEGKGDLSKDGQAANQAKLQPTEAEHARTHRATAEQAEPSGPKSATAAQAKGPAAPGQQGEAVQAGRANPTPAALAVEAPDRRPLGANDPALSAAKTVGPASGASPTQAGLSGFDPMQGAARTAAAPTASTPSAERPVTPNEVAVHIQRAAARGENRIRIQLHPAELGQIDVRLKVGTDGIVRAAIQVDRPETLDMMQRDARGLERALQDAGLKTDSGSLSFNLRDSGHGGPRDRDGQAPSGGPVTVAGDPRPAIETLEIPVQSGWSSRALDMRV